MKNKSKSKIEITMVLILLMFFFLIPLVKTLGADASAISFGKIDYANLTMLVYNNQNTIVYYSTDKSSWTEVEGAYSNTTGAYTMDISWVSEKSDVTLYFKGDVVTTVKSVILPMQNTSFSVSYDKAESEFTFEEVEDSETFQWRKASDYNWTTVEFEEASSSYTKFMKQIANFSVKGAKILIRTPQVAGTGAGNVGTRPSKEISISIPARSAAPSVKVNSSKLTTNTTTVMEYYDSNTALWVECTKSMTIEELAPAALFENGGKTQTVKIRKAATSSSPYSKTTTLTIPGQAAAPTLGGNTSDVTYYYMNSKLMLQFNNSSTANCYEYTIIKSSGTYDVAKVSWKTVNNTKLMKLSSVTAPEGCTVYVRKKGTDENTTKNISLVLSSAVSSFTVAY